MEPLNSFSPIIWKGHFPGDLSAVRDRAYHLLHTSQHLNSFLTTDGGVSSVEDTDGPHMWPESVELIDWLTRNAVETLKAWNFFHTNTYIDGSWVNLHPPGAWTKEHSHGNSAISVAVYLDQPENGGNLEVQDPLFYHWSGYPKENELWKEVEVKPGDVLMFPGWLVHRTQRNLSQSNRVVMSMNVLSFAEDCFIVPKII